MGVSLEKQTIVVYNLGLMKTYRQSILAASLLGVLLFLGGMPVSSISEVLAAGEAQLVDRIVAVVNSEVITESELDAYLRSIYEQYKNEYSGDKLMQIMTEARAKLLNQMIEDKLVLQEAKAQELEVKESEIDELTLDFKGRFKSETEMEEVMKTEGMTMKEVRERFEKQILIRKLQDRQVRAMVVVSPTEVDKYYEEHAAEFTEEERIKVRSITIKKSDEAKQKGIMDEEAKNRILDLRKKIVEQNEDFGKLAKNFSDDTKAKADGLSDWVKRGEMIPVIDDVLFKIPEGKVTEVIETPMGYHIFRIEEKRQGKKKTLEEAREEIQGKIFKTKAEARFQEWMTQLKKKAYISIR